MRSVSFIVPALNAATTLDACLKAILAARAADTRREVILVDNGSTDQTVEIAKTHGVKVLHGPGLTVAALRNLGARVAMGDVLAFVDSDCVVAGDWIESGLFNFEDPTVGAVGSPTDVRADATWVESTWKLHRHRSNRRRLVTWLATENLLVRRTAFHELGGFNEALATCEDTDFCYRLGVRYRIVNDPAVKSIHLGEARSLWRFLRKEMWRGRGNLPGFLSHGFTVSELPSLLLPLYHGAWIVALLGATGYGLASGRWEPTQFAATVLLLPPLLLAFHTSVRTRRFRPFAKLIALYLTYATARAVAIVAGTLAAAPAASVINARDGRADAVTRRMKTP